MFVHSTAHVGWGYPSN